MINLKARAKIAIENLEDIEWVYLNTFYACEKNIAEKLTVLKYAKNIKKIKDFEKKFKQEEKKVDINLSEKQKEAIKLVNENNVCIILAVGFNLHTVIAVCADTLGVADYACE